jgi:hypothetical protein
MLVMDPAELVAAVLRAEQVNGLREVFAFVGRISFDALGVIVRGELPGDPFTVLVSFEELDLGP